MSSLNLSGSLRSIPLPDIVRLLHTTRRTGQLAITDRGVTGSIFFEGGELIDGQSNQLSGLDAIRHIALFTHGDFEFFDGIDSSAKTLSVLPSADIIAILEARMLEAIQIQELMPRDHDIPRYLGGTIPNDFDLTAAELAVAMKSSSGTLSAARLSRELGLDAMAVRYAVARFRAIGLMELSEGPIEPEPVATEAPRPLPDAVAPPAPSTSSQPRYWRGRRID